MFEYLYNPIVLGFAWIILVESIGFRFFYRISWSSIFVRMFLLNLYSLSTLGAFSIVGTLLDYWSFIFNWSVRDFFLALLVVEFPMAVFALPKSPFKKVFSAVVLVNFLSCLVLSFVIAWVPYAIGIPQKGTDQFYPEAKYNFVEIVNALEKYKEKKGHYPSYIYGGDRLSWIKSGHGIIDPLLAEDCIRNYPRNPLNLERSFFVPRRSPGWVSLFFGRKSPQYVEMRNTWYFTVREDPRFGFRGVKMANILSDPALESSYRFQDYRLIKVGYESGRQYYLPGAFVYRSFDLTGDGYPDAYFLGLLGGEDETGKDLYDRNRNSVADIVKINKIMKLKTVSDGEPDGIMEFHLGGEESWIDGL